MGTIWLTGLSGAGKTTLAKYLVKYYNAVLVDGDDLREGISKNVGFDDEGRLKNILLAAHVCKLVNASEKMCVAAMTSPLESQRAAAKEIINDLFVVYVACDLDTLKERDTKGLYKQFDMGVIKNMVGLDLPYEVPDKAHLVVNTAIMSIKQCRDLIIEAYLKHTNFRIK
jgi:adenylyl-sulfate kinase